MAGSCNVIVPMKILSLFAMYVQIVFILWFAISSTVAADGAGDDPPSGNLPPLIRTPPPPPPPPRSSPPPHFPPPQGPPPHFPPPQGSPPPHFPPPRGSPPPPPPPSPPPPSPPPPPPSPPPPAAGPVHPPSPLPGPPPHRPPRRVRCRYSGSPSCFNIWFTCPPQCPYNCLVDCVACKPVCGCNFPGAICEDPKFVGGDGVTFYFHGRKDRDFCLVSDSNLHINAHFIGKRNHGMKRDFTWVQSIGVIFDNHKLLIAAKRTSKWDDNVDRLAISYDSNPVPLKPAKEGTKWHSTNDPVITISRIRDANGIAVEAKCLGFRILANVVPIGEEESRVHGYNITKEDCFAHLDLGFKFYNLSDEVDGVLGQTYRRNYVTRANIRSSMPVLGGADKFHSSHIFSTDCLASKFGKLGARDEEIKGRDYGSLKCGMNGNGVVCKK